MSTSVSLGGCACSGGDPGPQQIPCLWAWGWVVEKEAWAQRRDGGLAHFGSAIVTPFPRKGTPRTQGLFPVEHRPLWCLGDPRLVLWFCVCLCACPCIWVGHLCFRAVRFDVSEDMCACMCVV